MDSQRRKEALSRGKPAVTWQGEPALGGWYTEAEIKAVVDAIRSSEEWTTGFGYRDDGPIARFERAFAEYVGTEHAVAVNGAATGLDMAMKCLDLRPHDEVIVPAINFRASSMSVIGEGARLVLGEVDPRTFQLDPNHVEELVSPNTRAIYPTHMNGLSAPIDDLEEIAERHPHPEFGPPKVVGDAARCGWGWYRGTRIGNRGWMTVFSFHTMKLMTTLGEGGMVTTNDPDAAQRLRSLRVFGSADSWGTNYQMTKPQAAVGLVQLERLDEMCELRRKRALERTEMLQGIPGITLPYEPDDCVHSYYLYTCLVPEEWAGEKRDQLCRMLTEEFGIGTIVANAGVHETIPFIRKHAVNVDLPVTEGIGQRLFCPSLHPLMSEEDNAYVCAALWECVERIAAG